MSIIAVRRVQYDLIVLPEPLEKLLGFIVAHSPRHRLQDLIDRAFAVDRGVYLLLRRVDRESEVGVGVGAVDQDGD